MENKSLKTGAGVPVPGGIDPVFFYNVISEEKKQLRLRRQKLNLEHGTPEQENWFGIALSGGGIRSATFNLGFLKTLNRFGILQKADYLSTVSGGGYTQAYVQMTTKQTGDMGQLFTEAHADAMRQHGDYLTPGTGFWKIGNTFLLAIAYFISWCMSMLGPLVIFGILYFAYGILAGLLGSNPFAGTAADASYCADWIIYGVAGVFGVHFFTNVFLNFNLGISKLFNKFESVLIAAVLALVLWQKIAGLSDYGTKTPILLGLMRMVTLFVIGYYTNPNAISFHRYYRKQLADLYLRFADGYRNLPLHQVFDAHADDPKQYLAPYPLINTCLNLQNPDGSEDFAGSKASDYFLLSPLYCGSKLTGYVPTSYYDDFRSMTLPAAVTVSAAAVNPGLGMYSSKLLSVLITLANARLGFWVPNPKVVKSPYAVVWWPVYFFRELLGRIGMKTKMVNISDGGHIENLGVYELLRRDCRLIIAVDAGEDKEYAFADLNNMLIRARNELGIEVAFRGKQQPEDIIRPRPSQVYSTRRYAVADIWRSWEVQEYVDENGEVQKREVPFPDGPVKTGLFVYVKSSVTAPRGKPTFFKDPNLTEAQAKKLELDRKNYYYKIYHPDFPHEPTSDQFFDPVQWEAYYQLGQFIGADILGLEHPEGDPSCDMHDVTVEQLINWFNHPLEHPLFEKRQEPAAAPEAQMPESAREAAPPPQANYRM